MFTGASNSSRHFCFLQITTFRNFIGKNAHCHGCSVKIMKTPDLRGHSGLILDTTCRLSINSSKSCEFQMFRKCVADTASKTRGNAISCAVSAVTTVPHSA